jgi:hypothetical protein
MNESGLRFVYRVILRLHPEGFRERFAAEMLWIFDEECRRGRALRSLVDVVASLLRQRGRVADEPLPALDGFGLLDTGPGSVRAALCRPGLQHRSSWLASCCCWGGRGIFSSRRSAYRWGRVIRSVISRLRRGRFHSLKLRPSFIVRLTQAGSTVLRPMLFG